MSKVTVQTLPSRDPSPKSPPDHWVGNPPTHFRNPWSSWTKHGFTDALHTRFGPNRKFVPVPESRDELVKVRTPDWGRGQSGWETGLKATWLGHAGFLIELPSVKLDAGLSQRGMTILVDAVFSERVSPFSWIGPKRFTPTPCQLSDLPEIDLIVISHNHYDHLDIATVKYVCEKQKAVGRNIQIFTGLNTKSWFMSAGLGVRDEDVHECDWWEEKLISIDGIGSINIACTPAQHASARTGWDAGRSLWCSWVIEDVQTNKRLYFAGDTAYKSIKSDSPCPEFERIGSVFGSFDLALLPIGCYSPRDFMSSVHTDPEGALEIHKAIKSKRSIGMHYGTVRGGLSQYYEDVREPPKLWRESCEKEGRWGECGLCDVGETVIV